MAQRYTAKFKFQVMIEVLTGETSAGQVARVYGVHPNTVNTWKQTFLEKGAEIFAKDSMVAEYERRIAELVRPMPITPTRALSPWSPRKHFNSLPHSLIHDSDRNRYATPVAPCRYSSGRACRQHRGCYNAPIMTRQPVVVANWKMEDAGAFAGWLPVRPRLAERASRPGQRPMHPDLARR